MIAEFKGYFWADGDSPVKRDDHCMDELRYFVMTQPKPAPVPLPPKSEIQTDKERLIRSVRRNERWIKNC